MKNSSTQRTRSIPFLHQPVLALPRWLHTLLATMACHFLLTLLFSGWEDTFPAMALLLSFLAGSALTWAFSSLFSQPPGPAGCTSSPAPACRFLLVQSADKYLSVPVEQVSCIFRAGRHTVLRRSDKTEYLLPMTLRDVIGQLDEGQFFQVNRRLIIHRQACISYQAAPYGKLLLTLQQPLSEPVTVSQGKAAAFRKWMAYQVVL